MADEFERVKDLYDWNASYFVIVGAWPLKSNYIIFTACIMYLLIHMSAEFTDLYFSFGNLELMIFNLSESTLEIMILAKMLVMRFSQTLVKLMNKIMDGIDAKYFESAEEKEIYLNYNRIAKYFFKLWVTMGSSASTLYHLKPLEFRLRAGNESVPFVLPYRSHFFFEVNDDITFWLVWTYQLPMIYINLFHTMGVAYLFCLVLHVCGLLSVLAFRIKKIDNTLRENPRLSSNVFREVVERHRNIIGFVDMTSLEKLLAGKLSIKTMAPKIQPHEFSRFLVLSHVAKDIDKVFHLLLLEELFISTVILGLTAYTVLLNADFTDLPVFISFMGYGSTVLVIIYGYCIAGEFLITESMNVYDAYYQCEWYDLPEKFKKQIMICIVGTSKPITLTAGGFYTFSVASFTSIVKTAMGYVSMLRTVI